MFACEPFACAAKTGVNLIEKKQSIIFIAEIPQHRQELGRRNVDASADLDRLDQDRPDLTPAKKPPDIALDGF
jgi:hypothetical protein